MLTNDNGPETTSNDHCRFLRCKEMFIDTGRDFHVSQSGSGIYWCSHTQNCVGPDGQTVTLEDCRWGRSSHEAC